MIQSLRDIAHSWVIKALMLFLVVSFSIWGIGDIFQGNSLQKAVAKVGKTEISVQELNTLFERELTQIRQQVSPNITGEQAREMGLLDRALEREINTRLIDMDLARREIAVGPQTVLQLLAKEPQFRAKDGSFNKQLFQQILEREHLSERAFIERIQKDMSREILLSSLSTGSFVPKAGAEALYAARAQKRMLDVVTVDASKIGGIPSPDETNLKNFYEKNQQLFAAPEYRAITIATLSTESVAKDITVSDEQAKKEFESKREQMTEPEKRDVWQAVLKHEEQAKQIVQLARASGNLQTAAKEQKGNALLVEKLEEQNLIPELAKAIFSLRENEISDPVKTTLGWHVIQLKRITRAGTPTFEAVKDKLREEIRRDQAVEAATRLVNQLDDELAAGHSLDDVADGLKLRLVKIPAIDKEGKKPDGKEPDEFPNKEEALKTAFAQNAGETGPVEDDKGGNYFVVRTDDVTASGIRPYEEIKARVASLWTAHEQALKAQAKAEKIVAAMRGGADMASFNSDTSVSFRSSSPLSLLGDTDRLLPQPLVTAAFKLKKGEVASAEDGNKQVIVRLASVINADLSKPDTRKNMIAAEIRRDGNNELLEQYVRHLATVFPVKKNAALLQQMKQKE